MTVSPKVILIMPGGRRRLCGRCWCYLPRCTHPRPSLTRTGESWGERRRTERGRENGRDGREEEELGRARGEEEMGTGEGEKGGGEVRGSTLIDGREKYEC